MKSRIEGERESRRKVEVGYMSHRWAAPGLLGVFLVAASGGGVGCGSRVADSIGSTDTGNPPIIDTGRITAQLVGAEVRVEGEDGAVPGGAAVTVSDPATGKELTVVADDDGSFVVVMSAEGSSDSVVLVVESGGESTQTVVDVSTEPAPDSDVPASAPLSAPPANPVTDAEEPASQAEPATEPAADAGSASPAPGMSLPLGAGSSDVDLSMVDWGRSLDIPFEEDSLGRVGLWMGTGLTDAWPVEPVSEPPYPVEAQLLALHLTGEPVAAGVDVYLHTAMPFESLFQGVYFIARSTLAGGQTVRVTVGGPSEDYWTDTSQGQSWPAVELTLGQAWAKYVVDFRALGFDAEHLSPHSDTFGAVHFLVDPEQAYDFEITGLNGLEFTD